MQVSIDYIDGMAFNAHTASGHDIRLDSSPDFGGQDYGARPMELILAGLGGCSSIDVMSILRKSRQQVTACKVTVDGHRRDEIPKIFTSIELHFTVSGKQLDPKKVERAIKLSAEKYCSVAAMLEDKVTLQHSFEVLETTEKEC